MTRFLSLLLMLITGSLSAEPVDLSTLTRVILPACPGYVARRGGERILDAHTFIRHQQDVP